MKSESSNGGMRFFPARLIFRTSCTASAMGLMWKALRPGPYSPERQRQTAAHVIDWQVPAPQSRDLRQLWPSLANGAQVCPSAQEPEMQLPKKTWRHASPVRPCSVHTPLTHSNGRLHCRYPEAGLQGSPARPGSPHAPVVAPTEVGLH